MNHTERHDISWEEVSENMVRMRMEEEVTEASEVKRFEVQLIHDAFETTAVQQQRAAELLKLNATTLNSMIKRYGIPWEATKIAAEADLLTGRCEKNTGSTLLPTSDQGFDRTNGA